MNHANSSAPPTTVPIPQSRLLAAMETVDITPPVGIYHRMWGAAAHDQSTGVHRPLTATVMAIAPSSEADGSHDTEPKILVAVDHCLFWSQEMNAVLDTMSSQSGIAKSQIHVLFTHTHAAGLMGGERESLPGGDQIRPYLNTLAKRIGDSIARSLESLRPATILYSETQCDLAANRDYWDASRSSYVCGFHPGGPADTTVLTGRVLADDDTLIGTLVNYACHPTTLAWDNTLISPDYLGAMREVIQQQHKGPCLFIQGASGDIGPRDGFVGDTDVADRNGRQLGYAALSALETAIGPSQQWQYQGAVVSGATIGTWARTPLDAAQKRQTTRFHASHPTVTLAYRDDLPVASELESERQRWQAEEQSAHQRGDQAAAADARAMAERMTRRLTRVHHLPADAYPYVIDILTLGNAVWVLLNGEHYNLLQREIRRRLQPLTVIIATLVNGSEVWYLPDRDSYGKGLYQEDASVLAAGSLEHVIDAVCEHVLNETNA